MSDKNKETFFKNLILIEKLCLLATKISAKDIVDGVGPNEEVTKIKEELVKTH